jgi:predicted DsbA family dithiol-disulfide isomerase
LFFSNNHNQQRLAKNLSEYPRASTIDKEWENIKTAMKKAANEPIGIKKKYRRKKGLRIWNEEIKNAIENKRRAYQKYLQNPSEENFETYKITRNIAKTIFSKTHKESWDRFISRIESDIFGEKSMAYKVLKHLNRANI